MTEATARDPMAARSAWLAGFESAAQADQRRLAGSESAWSWARLAFFAAALLVWVPLGAWPLAAGLLSLAGVIAFIHAVRRHTALRAEREQADRVLLMVAEARQRLGGQVALVRSCERPAVEKDEPPLEPLLQDGATWSLTEQERDDLDLFARPVGLFGLLNRTSTLLGARRLRERLDHLMLDPAHIRARQETVSWLADHPEVRLRLLAALAVLRKEDRRLAGWLRAVRDAVPLDAFTGGTAPVVWSWLGGLLMLGALGAMIAGDVRWGWLLGAVTTINLIVFVRSAGALGAAIRPWRDVAWAARGVLIATRRGAEFLPADVRELEKLRTALAAVIRPEVLPRQCARLGWTDNGGIVGFLMNLVALSDLHIARALVGPAVAHRGELLAAASALADLECVLSLASFAWEQPITCRPVPQDARALRIDGGRHPLVAADRVVPNTVLLDAERRIWIITGSNMAGKSTLLRMVGANVVLAQMGAVALADALHWSPMRLITDLRARDNLAANESYFLSEVRHLRRMILPPPGQAPILGLIDEPFRGTNSHDQTAASRAVLLHLLESQHLFLVATHDRYLTELADGSAAQNFHFRENLGREGMVFDYCLHDGPATTRNALQVLEREGYPAALLARAHAWHGDELPAAAQGTG